jgi:chromosome segregation ATPase
VVALTFSFKTFSDNTDVKTAKSNEARNIWLKGFELYEKAESNEKISKYDEAKKGFEEALIYFKNVQTKHPEWNNTLVDYRIKKCLNKIEGLSLLIGKSRDSAKSAKTKPSETAPDFTPLEKKLQEQLQQSNNRLDAALSALAEAKKEAARGLLASEETSRLVKEKTDLEKKYAILSAELAKISEKISPQNETAQIELFKKENKIFNEQKKGYDDKIKELSDSNERLKKDIQSLNLSRTESNYNMSEQEKLIETLGRNVEEAREQVETAVKKQNTDESKYKDIKAELEAAVKNLDDAKAENNTLAKRINELVEKNDSSALVKQLQTENQLLSNDLSSVRNAIDKIKKDLNSTAQDKETLLAKIAKYETIMADLSKKNAQMSPDIDSLKRKNEEALTTIESQKKDIFRLATEKREMETNLKTIAEKTEKLSRKDSDYTELAKFCAELEEVNKTLKGKIAAVETEKNVLNDKIKADAAKTEEIKKNFEKEKENFEKKLCSFEPILAENETLKKELVEKNDSGARDKEALLAKIAKHETVTAELSKKNAQMSPDIDSLKRKNEEAAATIESQKKDISRLITEKKDIETHLKTVAEKMEKLSEKDSDYANLTKFCAELEEANKTLKKESAANEEKSDNNLKLLNQTEEQIAALSKENKSLDKTTRELKRKIEIMSQKAPDAAVLATDKKEIEEQKTAIADLKKELEKINDHNDALRKRLEEKVINDAVPQKFREEKEKLLAELEEKNKLIQELKKGEDKKKDAPPKKKKASASTNSAYQPKKENEKVALLLAAAENAEKNNDIESAIWHYQKVFEFDKKHQKSLCKLAEIFIAVGKNDRATAYLNEALLNEPESSEISLFIAKIIMRLSPEKKGEAQKWYSKAIEMGSPKDEELEALFNR